MNGNVLSLSSVCVMLLASCGGGSSSNNQNEMSNDEREPTTTSLFSTSRTEKTPIELGVRLEGKALQAGLFHPNSDVLFCNGTTETILWDPSMFPGQNVDFYILFDDPRSLVDPGVDISDNNKSAQWTYKGQYQEFGALLMERHFVLKIDGAPNTGQFEVDPRLFFGVGNAFLMLIVSQEDSSIFDVSDSPFVMDHDPSRAGPEFNCE